MKPLNRNYKVVLLLILFLVIINLLFFYSCNYPPPDESKQQIENLKEELRILGLRLDSLNKVRDQLLKDIEEQDKKLKMMQEAIDSLKNMN
ncbi:MAG: DUF3450 domain-containing protein [Ignavibacteria bacterium]|nr:DUF3450 domain-containing protein [Ignavibacteria bacterium]